MEFGKVEDPSLVDFTLAPDPATNRRFLSGTTNPDFSFFFGTSQWHDPGYYGTLYPEKIKKGEELLWYGKQFNTIEFNPSFYAVPQEANMQRWKNLVPVGFTFCCKVPRSISHASRLSLQHEAMQRFLSAIQAFGECLGPSFMQLPPQVRPDRLPEILQFLSGLHFPSPFFVEVRHPDWFTEAGVHQQLVEGLSERGIGLVISDVSGRRDAAHMTLTTPDVMIRWVGNEGHITDRERLQSWAQRLAAWQQKGLRRAWFFLHQPNPGLVPAGARIFAALLSDNGIPVKKTARPAVQQGLF
jgi:uncharacterized protein YecE (DUF72 family)